jgi:hypothetical protein
MCCLVVDYREICDRIEPLPDLFWPFRARHSICRTLRYLISPYRRPTVVQQSWSRAMLQAPDPLPMMYHSTSSAFARSRLPYFQNSHGVGHPKTIATNASIELPHPYPSDMYIYGANKGKP